MQDVLALDLFKSDKLARKQRRRFLRLVQLFVKIGWGQHAGRVERDSALDHVFEFANISGPGVAGKHLKHILMNRDCFAH